MLNLQAVSEYCQINPTLFFQCNFTSSVDHLFVKSGKDEQICHGNEVSNHICGGVIEQDLFFVNPKL